MRHYATLFDKNYLAKGLAMYESLKRHSSEPFMLHVLPLDETVDSAGMFDFNDTSIYPYDTFAYHRSMPYREWCWSLASQFVELLIFQFGLHEITYLDADLFFFSDPKVIHDEIGDRSIGIIPHRLIPSKRHLEVNGKFNVGWVTFKNTPVGRECLSRWAQQVRERCDAFTCGDQKYLDEWPERYGVEVCIIQNIGANVAPWNVANYYIHKAANSDRIYMNSPERRGWLCFYHFHEYEHGKRLTNYELRPEDIELIYKPYIKAINDAQLATTACL